MVVGIGALNFFEGAINTSSWDTITMEWPTPSFIYACPLPQRFGVYSDEGRVNCYITQFEDAQGVHNVSWPHMFRDDCTSVTFRLDVVDSYARVICRVDFFS